MPQQLEYDEQGSTFYYFLISFYGLVLLPATYFLWPYKKKGESAAGLVCQCDPCRHKRVRLEEEQPRETLWIVTKVAVLCVLWGLLFFMLYKSWTPVPLWLRFASSIVASARYSTLTSRVGIRTCL
jgi:translocation protein SEC63